MKKTIDSQLSTKFFLPANTGEFHSKNLGSYIEENAPIIGDFISAAKNNQSPILVEYQDLYLNSVFGMVLTLQVIEHFVTQIGKDFSIVFNIGPCNNKDCSQDKTTSLFTDAGDREKKLRELIKTWNTNLEVQNNFKCTGVSVNSLEHDVHTRALTITCENKTLSIFPYGGFAHGWRLLKPFVSDEVDIVDDIVMNLSTDILYFVAID